MTEKQILVLVKRPGEPAVVEPCFDNTLEAFQNAVGGYIEVFPIADKIVCICNEEGKLMGLPHNINILGEDLVGTLVICGTKGDEFASLKAAQVPALRILLEG